ncbi:unnamed protein product [Blepharisma stoltei]|uniref:Uncharacterized protein n=1 Tax=Blepharisma stoltei TaxID=1481888 RepID=A0AAU9J1U6_9CILI|nr:unnamed protein product [Blepharisma stoltei]
MAEAGYVEIVSALEARIAEQDLQINELKKELEETKLQLLEQAFTHEVHSPQPPQIPEGSKPEIEIPKAGHGRAFMTKSVKFFAKIVGGVATIEFPKGAQKQDSEAEAPSLLREMTKNSFLTHQFKELDQAKQQKQDLENEIQNHAEKIRQQSEVQVKALQDSYAPLLEKEQATISDLIKSIGKELDGAIICENDSERAYIVDHFDQNTLQISLQQVLDKNGIALKEPKAIQREFQSLGPVHAMHRSEIDQFMQTLQDKMITVQYQIVEIDGEEKMCCPIYITPNFISLQDYEIRFNKNEEKITDIVNKEDGNVKFEAIHVSEECGLVRDTIVEVFTAEMNPHILNIIHLHIDDMKEEIPVEAVYIMDSQSADDYGDWIRDARGIDLRYKILVRSGKIEAVLYNTGQTTEKLHFIERRLKVGDYVQIHENAVAQVTLIPYGLLARDWTAKNAELPDIFNHLSPSSYCMKRHVEDTPGYINVKLILENGDTVENQREMSYPICQCGELGDFEKIQLMSLFEFIESKKKGNIEETLRTLQGMTEDYRHSRYTDKREFLDQISKLTQKAREGLANDEGLRPLWGELIQNADRIVRTLATEIRFGAF